MSFEKHNKLSAKEDADTEAVVLESTLESFSDSEKDTASIAKLRTEIETLNKSVRQTTQWETLKQFGIEPHSVKAHDAIERLVYEREAEIHRLEQERITTEQKASASKEHARIAQIHAEFDVLNEAVHRSAERETLKNLGVPVPQGTRTHDFIEAEANQRLDELKRLEKPPIAAESAVGDVEKYHARDTRPAEAKAEPSEKENIETSEQFYGLNFESPRGHVTLPEGAHLAQFDGELFHATLHKNPNQKGYEKGFEYNINQEALKGVLLEVDDGQLFRADTDSRFIVICKVQNIHVPFYISSDGTDGKRVSEWYPFFGRAGESGWLIKGEVNKKTGDMFYHEEISRVQNILNENLKFPAQFFDIHGTVSSGRDGRTLFDVKKYLKYKRVEKSAQITGYHPDLQKIGREDSLEADEWIREIVASIKADSAEPTSARTTASEREMLEQEQFPGLNFESVAGRVMLPKDARPAQLKPGSWVPKGLMVRVGNEQVQVRIDRDALKDVLLESGGAVVHILSGDGGPERRFMVLARVGDAHLPFYRSSSGTGGKKQGEWYPFFGHTGNWVIKGEIAVDGSMTYLHEITRVQDILNEHLVLPDSRKVNDKDFKIVFSDNTVAFSVGDEIPIAGLLNSEESKSNDRQEEGERLYVARVTGYDPSSLKGYHPKDNDSTRTELSHIWKRQILQEIHKVQPEHPSGLLVPETDYIEVPKEELRPQIIIETGRHSAPRAVTLQKVESEKEIVRATPNEEKINQTEIGAGSFGVAEADIIPVQETEAAPSTEDTEDPKEQMRLRRRVGDIRNSVFDLFKEFKLRDANDLESFIKPIAQKKIKEGVEQLSAIFDSKEQVDSEQISLALTKVHDGISEITISRVVSKGEKDTQESLDKIRMAAEHLDIALAHDSLQNEPSNLKTTITALRDWCSEIKREALSRQEFLGEEKMREGRLKRGSREVAETLHSFVRTNMFRDKDNLVELWDTHALGNIKAGTEVLGNTGSSVRQIDFQILTEALVKVATGLKEANPQSQIGVHEDSDSLRQLAVRLQELPEYLRSISQNVPEEEQETSVAVRKLLESVEDVERFLSQRAQLVEDISS